MMEDKLLEKYQDIWHDLYQKYAYAFKNYEDFLLIIKSFLKRFIKDYPNENITKDRYLNGAKKENITFGVHLEKGVFCCLVKENVGKKNILMSLISPFLFLGVIPYIVGIISENIVITFLALLNIAGCSGDLIMFIDFLKLKDFEYSEFDNPVAFGLYSKEDLSQKKLLGLKYVETTSNLEIKDFEKITISKTSWWFMLIYYLFGFLFLIYI